MSFSAADCIFERALEIPYLHLEDMFVAGFGGTACDVQIYNDANFLWFYGLNPKKKTVLKWNVLFHYTKKENFESKIRKKISQFNYNNSSRC